MTAPALADLLRVKTIVDRLTPGQLEAWLRMGQRMVDGMPAADAEALLWAEMAREERA